MVVLRGVLIAVFVGVPTALRPAEEVAEAREAREAHGNPLTPPGQGRSKVAPSMMSPLPGFKSFKSRCPCSTHVILIIFKRCM